jgi:hypothetical protein
MPSNYDEYFSRIRAAESGGNKYAKNPHKGQTASGLYQFTKGTWEGLGFDWKDRFDEGAQTQAVLKFTKQNEDYLKNKLGIKPTYADLYGAHFLGAAGYAKLYKTDNNQPLTTVMTPQEIAVNGGYTKNKDGSVKTVGQLKEILAKKTGQPATPSTQQYSSQTSQPTEEYKELPTFLESNRGEIQTAGEYKEPKEVQEAKQQLIQAQNEENFLNEFNQLFSQPQEEQPQQDFNYLQQAELFSLPQVEFQEGGVIEDNRGQWAHPGKITKINSPSITMQGVNYPLLGIANTGEQKVMMPGKEYYFQNAKSVTEIPLLQEGGEWVEIDRGDGRIEKINTDSDEYREMYSQGQLGNYTGKEEVSLPELEEITLVGLRGSKNKVSSVDTSDFDLNTQNRLLYNDSILSKKDTFFTNR